MSKAELAKLTHKRTTLKSTLTRLSNFIADNNESVIDLKSRYEKLQPCLNQFEDIQTDIEILENSTVDEAQRTEFENTYFDLIAKYKNSINKLENCNRDIKPTTQTTSKLQLPPVNIPPFSGSYQEWIPFYDTFSSLVHNDKSLSEIQKFHYLKSTVIGEAATLIQSLPLSNENYNIAWDMLYTRYDNKRLIIQQHIKAIFELPSAVKRTHSILRNIVDSFLKHMRALIALKRPVDHWDDLLVYILSSKLDSLTKEEWENTLTSPISIPSLEDLTNFLTKKCQVLESVQPISRQTVDFKTKNQSNVVHLTTYKQVCPICTGKHLVYQCDTFVKSSVEERINAARSKRLCLNCLKAGHRTGICTSSSCKICKKRHNTLLHLESEPPKIEPTPSFNHALNHNVYSETLLSTALILVTDINGQLQECRVLLDSGSQSNLITSKFADKLGLKQDDIKVPVLGINQSSTQINKRVNTRINSRVNAFQTNIKCLVISNITSHLPSVTLNRQHFNIPKNIKLADPNFNISQPIDMLLGVDIFWKIMCVGQIRSSTDETCLQKTHFGWIVAGTFEHTVTRKSNTICNLITNEILNDQLTRFWQLEDCAQVKYNKEESVCEKHFINTHQRNNEGRFIVQLPFKESPPPIGNSYNTALKRFHNLERRLNQNLQLKRQYSDFLREYEQLGHMIEIPANPAAEDPSLYYYLPHHAVEKSDSTTTKVRVVFDGSCKTTSGYSLNDQLLVGPTIQQDLFSIICRFRTHKIALTADITKMYRQVLVNEDDCNLQRILWRENNEDDVKIYNLKTITYGTSSASFLAIRSLQQLAEDKANYFPVGSTIAKRDFYVDDLITGANTLAEAKNIITEITALLERGKFPLRKWHSNIPQVFENTTVDSSKGIVQSLDKNIDVKALGLLWNTTNDSLYYHIPKFLIPTKITKRVILSFISQLFDPLGLLSPVIIIGKMLLQQLWQLQIHWDESVPASVHSEFYEYADQLNALQTLKISRPVISLQSYTRLELHGFSDASQSAYGACIYVKTVSNNNLYSSHLLCAKSKVAPLKTVTIPRLELCGALLLSRLMRKVIDTINLEFTNIYYWTDSTIVLAWIKSTGKQWKTFVANRVNEISENTHSSQWHHVVSEENPADIISRGATPSRILDTNLWWYGPKFLNENLITNPITECELPSFIPEEKLVTACFVQEQPKDILFYRFSSWTKLLRVLAYCFRFINNIKVKLKRNKLVISHHFLTSNEIEDTTNYLIKIVQRESFPYDLASLKSSGSVQSKSRILSLNPFLDSNEIIRVGGRLRHASLPYNHKYPAILPSKHHITHLIIRHYHLMQLHAGVQCTMSAIRTKFWPLSLRNTTKHVLRKCVTCFKVNPTTESHIMGDLPSARLGQTRPFLNTGVDLCGPFLIRSNKKRGAKLLKLWVAVFVCFSSKAIHIETVDNLSTEAFLNALNRFINRRGRIANLYSDNGTNFVGADREIRKLYRQFFSKENLSTLAERLAEKEILWHFIPPKSPHFGGLWEAAVKSTKYHLYKIIGNNNLTYEQMLTLLTHVEAILNSRPITPFSDDPNDETALTPGHFLIGDSITTYVEPNLLNVPVNRLSCYQHIQMLKQHFWKRWHREYLSSLQQRTKWKTGSNNIKTGQLVIIKEDNLPPLQWALGRIIETHPGTDGIIRAASVRIRDHTVKRPTAKLCILPTE